MPIVNALRSYKGSNSLTDTLKMDSFVRSKDFAKAIIVIFTRILSSDKILSVL